MKNSKVKTINDSPQIFSVWSDEVIKNRVDAYFYQPKFKKLYEILKRGNYKIVKLSDLFDGDLVKGILPNSEEKDGDINVVQISNIGRDGVIDISDCITAKREIYREKHILKPNDILLVITGATIGKIGFWREESSNYYLGGDVVKFKVKSGFDPIFVWSYLRSEFGQNQILRHITGATNKHLAPEDLAGIQIPLLPIDKQKKVALAVQKAYEEKQKKEEEIRAILASIDGYVLGELGIDIAGEPEREEIAFAITSDEIEGRIDPFFYKPYFKILQRAIESKNYAELGELVEFAKETWDQKSIFDDQFPYIEISNIDTSNGEIAKTDFVPVAEAPSRAKMVVREGDIIVSTTRPNRGAITPISKEQDGFIASTGFAILRDLKDSKVLKDYLFAALRTSLSLRQMEQRTTGGNYPAITTEDLRKIKIVVPELKTQKKIVAGVKTIYNKARNLRQEAETVIVEAQKQTTEMIFA